MAEKKNNLRVSFVIGSIVTVVSAAVLLLGYIRAAGPAESLKTVAAYSAGAGLLCAVFFAKRWLALFAGISIGAFMGILSAGRLFLGTRFEGEFLVGSATLAFFTALGLLVGAVAEIIRLVHYLLHGGKFKKYPE